jgi:hypothetical protein
LCLLVQFCVFRGWCPVERYQLVVLRFAAPGAELLQSPVLLYSGVLGYWTVGLPHFKVSAGSQTVDLCPSGNCYAVVDTGTSFIGVTLDQFYSIQELVRPSFISFRIANVLLVRPWL